MAASTRAQSVTERLRRMILEGGLAPGSRLQERGLADRLGVSRTPVRDSLQVLASEGLLDYAPHSGYVVRKYVLDDVLDSFDMRIALEGMACRTLALKGLPEPEWAVIQSNLAASAACFARAEWTPEVRATWHELNLEFHDRLLRAAGNRYLVEGVALARRIPMIYDAELRRHSQAELLQLFTREQCQQACNDHRRIAEAIVERQPDRAEFLMREHIFTNREQIRRHAASWA